MSFLEKYPVVTHEILHFPMMFPVTFKKFHIPGIPYASLNFLYRFGAFHGLSEGTVRTALSRMKKAEDIIPVDSDDKVRYRVSALQMEAMQNVLSRKQKLRKGYVIAVYSFEKQQERERREIRTLLEYAGFIRFAQNAYINMQIDETELRKNLDAASLSGNVYLFNVDSMRDAEMAKLAVAWRIPERALFLEEFYRDAVAFLAGTDGSDADIFNRVGTVWIAFILHVNNTEMPLPEEMLPADYAFARIQKYLNGQSMQQGKRMLDYYLKENR
jgi:DNA-binding transcriptional regulator PaaX